MSHSYSRLHWIRLLFPKWNFFDRPGPNLTLWVKAHTDHQWTPILFKQNRCLWGLFFNLKTNLALAQKTLLERFYFDWIEFDLTSNDQDSIETLPSFKLLYSFARLSVHASDQTPIDIRLVNQTKSQDETVLELKNLSFEAL